MNTISRAPQASSTGRLRGISASVAILAALGGCAANMSGIGGETSFKCKAPDGVPCQSIAGTYANARAGNLPSQQSLSSGPQLASDKSSPALGQAAADGRIAAATPTSISARQVANGPGPAIAPLASRAGPGMPASLGAIRSDPTVIRIWVAPWEDADGDLMDQTYVYLPVDSGRWLIEHNRQRIKRDFAPVRAPANAGVSSRPVAKRQDADKQSDTEDGMDGMNATDSAAALAARVARVPGTARPDGNAPGASQ